VTRAPLDLALPRDLDGAAAATLVADRLGVDLVRARATDRVLLDTFDRRLRADGLRADRDVSRRATATLRLHEPGAPVRRAQVPAADRYLATELPGGPLRDRLAPVLEERALLPIARVRSRAVALAVRDAAGKTVARVTVEHAEAVVGGRRAVPLTPRAVVAPVRGYDADFDRAVAALRDGLGLEPADVPADDEAVLASGGSVEGESSKPDVELQPGTRADVAAAVVLTRLADIAEANLPGALEDLDSEFLHDLRVSIRRARSALRELKGVHDPARRGRLRTELKWAQAVTGPVRDLDVQLEGWSGLAGGFDGELEPLRELLVRHRERERAALRRGLRSRRFARALERWRALAAEPPAPEDASDRPRAALPIEAVAADRIRSVYRRMVRDGRAIDDDTPDEALHELRKRGKELRYLLELFGSVFPRDVVKPMVKALKGLQDVLGEFQDLTVQIGRLRDGAEELAEQPGGSDALLAAGRLIARLEARQHEVRATFAASFAEFSAPDRRAVVRDTFPKLRGA
jgi:CHAD domain-containing protein